jgi:hypothetical protein
MYNRMTLVLPQHRIVVATSIYVAVAFVCIPSLCSSLSNFQYRLSWRYFTLLSGVAPSDSTLPFQRTRVRRTRQLLNPLLTISEQCSAATNHLITNAVFNISSDLIILSIPMPLLFKVRLPIKNKVVLVSKTSCAL